MSATDTFEDDVFFDVEQLEPTLQNVIDQTSLKMIFVGGKGGVGKTTVSCALASLLSFHRESVLLISTDPAHNLSDAFAQQFSDIPTLVHGFDNLFALEIDPKPLATTGTDVLGGSMFSDMLSSFPGIDEVMSFVEMMKMVETMNFEVTVFDTAPTGHTLRLLQFPKLMEGGIFSMFTGSMAPLLNSVSSMFGMNLGESSNRDRLEDRQKMFSQLQAMFTDKNQTTFVCVCIAEVLSMYETERLIQELRRFGIDSHNLVVNQLLFPQEGCTMCSARSRIQQKYLDQLLDLYQDFHIVKLPLFPIEVRGPNRLTRFSRRLVDPVFRPPETSEGDDAPSA
nr:arsenical pump-driving ATPase [Andalucia godoyi]|eukprot:ANDGO_02007.mRNA.1 ATPase ASNA1 homolog